MLRLVSSTVGPIAVPQGAAGPAQTVEAYNAGDGSLSLAAAFSASCLVPTIQAARACTSPTATGKPKSSWLKAQG